VVSENQPPSIMRVRCSAYPALSRVAGEYTVDRDNPAAVRRATGRIGSTPAATPNAPCGARPGGPARRRVRVLRSGGRILSGSRCSPEIATPISKAPGRALLRLRHERDVPRRVSAARSAGTSAATASLSPARRSASRTESRPRVHNCGGVER
jgi:hypothetical protein